MLLAGLYLAKHILLADFFSFFMITSKVKQQKRGRVQINHIQWSFIIVSAIIGFLVSLALAGASFLAAMLFLGPFDNMLRSVITLLLPTLALCITLLMVHEHVQHKKWLHTFIVFFITIVLWLCLFWLIAVF